MKLKELSLIVVLLSVILYSCSVADDKKGEEEYYPVILQDTLRSSASFCTQLTELKRCDILIKPNHNWMPGTTFIVGGSGFGHAIIVTEDCHAPSTDSLLRIAVIFESHARDVPPSYQIRAGKAYEPGDDFRHANISFEPKNTGYRYRLRMNLTEEQKDSILAFVICQDHGVSSWRALRPIDDTIKLTDSVNTNDIEYWYCTLLIWQAFHHVLGINLDANGGLVIYPNDVINSPYFDNNEADKEKRVRF